MYHMICHKLLETVHSNLNSYYQILSLKNCDGTAYLQTVRIKKNWKNIHKINFISILFCKSNQNLSAKRAKCLFHGDIFSFRGEKKKPINCTEEAISTKAVKIPAMISSYLWFTQLLHLIRYYILWLLLDFENFMRLCRGVIIGVGAIITKQTAITHHYNTDSGIV